MDPMEPRGTRGTLAKKPPKATGVKWVCEGRTGPLGLPDWSVSGVRKVNLVFLVKEENQEKRGPWVNKVTWVNPG